MRAFYYSFTASACLSLWRWKQSRKTSANQRLTKFSTNQSEEASVRRCTRIELNERSILCGKTSPRDTMGRRKSKRKPPPKKKMTGNLDTQFTCPFCNHEKSCDVKMERTRNTGIISCSVCLEEFQTPITYLSEPVDVYSDWIDACEAANQ